MRLFNHLYVIRMNNHELAIWSIHNKYQDVLLTRKGLQFERTGEYDGAFLDRDSTQE